MKELFLSPFEREVVKMIVHADTNRKEIDCYSLALNIPVLMFLHDLCGRKGIYLEKDDDELIFKYSRKAQGEDAKKEYLNNQRYIITILSVIEKLSMAGYLVFVTLTPQDIEEVYKSFAIYGCTGKIERIKYRFTSLQLVCPDFESKGFVVTEDLIRLVENDFKSEEQRRHEETISKANQQIKHTRCTLIITLITFIVSVAWNIVSCLCC